MSRALWNTRPIEDALRSTITAQEDVIRRLKEDAERLADWLSDYAIFDTSIDRHCDQVLSDHKELMNELGEK